jgi:hypothetical protein
LDLIPIESVVRPVFAFHDPDNKPLYQQEGISRREVAKARMWAITMDMWMKCRSGFRQSKEEMERFFYEPINEVVMNIEDDVAPENYEDRVLPFVLGPERMNQVVGEMRVNQDIGGVAVDDENDDDLELAANNYLEEEEYSDDEDNDVAEINASDSEDDNDADENDSDH